MERKTKRLRLIQLTIEDMELFSQEGGKELFEDRLNLNPTPDRPEHPGAFYKKYSRAYRRDLAKGIWYLFWDVVETDENRRIGGVLFKGPPDEAGEVEIGYGVDETHQRRGYGREAVESVVWWALEQPGVAAVTAKTNPGNLASQRLLQGIGMRHYKNIGHMPCWRIRKEDFKVWREKR